MKRNTTSSQQNPAMLAAKALDTAMAHALQIRPFIERREALQLADAISLAHRLACSLAYTGIVGAQ